MPNDDAFNPFVTFDQGGDFDEFVASVGELMETFIFNYCGTEPDWMRMRAALMKLIAKQDDDWDFVAEHPDERSE
jgi:hypothetical protein